MGVAIAAAALTAVVPVATVAGLAVALCTLAAGLVEYFCAADVIRADLSD